MAYYDDQYAWVQEHNTTYFHQDPVSFSGYGIDRNYEHVWESKFIDYNDNWYWSANNPSKSIAYEAEPITGGSEAVNAFNEPEFEEYDPTPYGGGYDIVSVYGKPLPPSDKTCYPRSKPRRLNFESEHEHEPESKPPVPIVPVHVPLELTGRDEEREVEEYPPSPTNYGYYDYPWPEYDRENASVPVGYDYYGKQQQLVQIAPTEYSPEVVDLCENIFGSWPCLARIRNQQTAIDYINNNNNSSPATEIGHRNPWEECAKYIFGRPVASSYNPI